MKLRPTYLLLLIFLLLKLFIAPALHHTSVKRERVVPAGRQYESAVKSGEFSFVNDNDDSEDNEDFSTTGKQQLPQVSAFFYHLLGEKGFLIHLFKNSTSVAGYTCTSYPGIFLRNRVIRI